MLQLDETFLVVIDVQDKLAQVVQEREALLDGCRRIVLCAQALGIPIVWTEQIPEKMGNTVPELGDLMGDSKPLAKSAFSCCGDDGFVAAITDLNRHQSLLVGIETHVCVYQTAVDLIGRDIHVEVVSDAVSSRTAANRQIGLDRIQQAGGGVTSVETAIFELMRGAENPAFRDILKIIK